MNLVTGLMALAALMATALAQTASDGCGAEGEIACEPCDNDDLDVVGGICTDLTEDTPCEDDGDCDGIVPDRFNPRTTVGTCRFAEDGDEIGVCIITSTAGGNIGK